MSLYSLIRQEHIRDSFRAFVHRPPFKIEVPLRAPPLTGNHRIVGTAFDYLLRFFLERVNARAAGSEWVAEKAVPLVGTNPKTKKAAAYVNDARTRYDAYLQDGHITDELLIAILRLAYLDVVYRAGPDKLIWEQLESPDPRDAADLRALLSVVEESDFKAQRTCYLNPTFGPASRLVGGADADLILDDRLLDIKTSKEPKLDIRDLYQLVGYYVLLNLAGVTGDDGTQINHQVESIGFYFARYGRVIEWPVQQVIASDSLSSFAEQFVQAACPLKARRDLYVKAMKGPLAMQIAKQSQSSRKPRAPSKAKTSRK